MVIGVEDDFTNPVRPEAHHAVTRYACPKRIRLLLVPPMAASFQASNLLAYSYFRRKKAVLLLTQPSDWNHNASDETAIPYTISSNGAVCAEPLRTQHHRQLPYLPCTRGTLVL